MAVSRLENNRKAIPTLVKDSELVELQRRRIVDAAVGLFVSKGFHQTTTREIARAAGFSIGSLYEYVASKEDVLYLVCDAIHGEMEARLREQIGEGAITLESLKRAVDAYLRVCDRMQDSILLIYRETASLTGESQRYVLRNEERITEIFTRILADGADRGVFQLKDHRTAQLMAHNIIVLGHMWAFRRWFLRDKYGLDDYIAHQTSLVVRELCGN